MGKEIGQRKLAKRVHAWSNLPTDLLRLTTERLCFADQTRFRAVCKSWHGISGVQSINKAWLMTHYRVRDDGNIKVVCNFFDISMNKTYTFKIDPMSYGEEIFKEFNILALVKASKNGWLLIQNYWSQFTFFYNPFHALKIIKLPALSNIGCNISNATFSTVPTSPDCMVFDIRTTSDSRGPKIIISICRCSDNEWISYIFDIKFVGFVRDTVYSKGKLYCVFSSGHLGAFCTTDRDWRVLSNLCPAIRKFDRYKYHMFEFDGEVVLVVLSKTWPNILVFNYDWSNMAWVWQDRLGNQQVSSNLANGINNFDIYPRFNCLKTLKHLLLSSWTVERTAWVVKHRSKKVLVASPHI